MPASEDSTDCSRTRPEGDGSAPGGARNETPARRGRGAGTGPCGQGPGAAQELRWVRRPTTRAVVPGVIGPLTMVQVLRGAHFDCARCQGGAAELRRKTWSQNRPTRPDYYLECPDCRGAEVLSAPAVEQLVRDQRPQALNLLWSFR